MEGSLKPKRVADVNCRRLRRPASRKTCKLQKCRKIDRRGFLVVSYRKKYLVSNAFLQNFSAVHQHDRRSFHSDWGAGEGASSSGRCCIHIPQHDSRGALPRGKVRCPECVPCPEYIMLRAWKGHVPAWKRWGTFLFARFLVCIQSMRERVLQVQEEPDILALQRAAAFGRRSSPVQDSRRLAAHRTNPTERLRDLHLRCWHCQSEHPSDSHWEHYT